MPIIEKIKKILVSEYYLLRGNILRMKNRVYHSPYTVRHYSERCGWQEFGAKDEAEYEYWWQEACGIVSLHMIMSALLPDNAGNQKTIFSQIQEAIDGGAYLQKTVDNKPVRVGWIHDKLAKIAIQKGLKGSPAQLNVNGICQAILSNKLVMASIYRPFTRFIDEGAPRKKAGGHLIVVSGFTWENGKCTDLFVADPYDKEARNEPIERQLFEDVYSGSAIIFSA